MTDDSGERIIPPYVHKQEDSSLACPSCGRHRISVLDSRVRAGNTIRRRRICNDCGRRWTTLELAIEIASMSDKVAHVRECVLAMSGELWALAETLETLE